MKYNAIVGKYLLFIYFPILNAIRKSNSLINVVIKVFGKRPSGRQCLRREDSIKKDVEAAEPNICIGEKSQSIGKDG